MEPLERSDMYVSHMTRFGRLSFRFFQRTRKGKGVLQLHLPTGLFMGNVPHKIERKALVRSTLRIHKELLPSLLSFSNKMVSIE